MLAPFEWAVLTTYSSMTSWIEGIIGSAENGGEKLQGAVSSPIPDIEKGIVGIEMERQSPSSHPGTPTRAQNPPRIKRAPTM